MATALDGFSPPREAYDRSPKAMPVDTNALSLGEQERLLGVAAQTGPGLQDAVMILLALRAGLNAREQCRLNIEHVAPCGGPAPAYVIAPGRRGSFTTALPRNAVPIPEVVRSELDALIAWKRDRCRHGDGRLGRDVGADGTVLCHVCRQPVDFGRAPLLQNRAGQRLSERQVH